MPQLQDLFSKTPHSRLSVAALYRLLIPQLLSVDIEKCIYLDADIIVNMDANELWQIDLGDKPFAAVSHVEADYMSHRIDKTKKSTNYLVTSGLVSADDYFNSGVLLMNLKVLRTMETRILDGMKFVSEHPQLHYVDQDALNYLFAKVYLKIPPKFNRFVRDARLEKNPSVQRKIYHFAGASFGMSMNDPFNLLWLKYFAKTPWFDEGTIGNLYAGFQQVHVGLKQSMINISAMMSGKTRAFFAAPNNIDALKKIFSIRDDEKIILADNQDALQRLLDLMKKSRGKRVFFILLPNFPFQALTQAGFVPGKDFVNGFEFLSEAHSVPFNSYQLIKAM